MTKKKKDLPQKERRYVEERAKALTGEKDDKMIVEGYAAIFDSPATNCGFTEIIARGAFDYTDMKDVVFRYNHKDGPLLLARTRNGSLKLKVDDKGLHVRAEFLDTQQSRDVYKSIEAELLDGMSFAFAVAKDGDTWDFDTNTRTVRNIKKLFDVSVVDTPFYSDTEIYARALDELENHKVELERDERAVEVLKLRNAILAKG